MRVALFTIVHNESFYLNIWYKYYSKFFDNIYIIDHNSNDSVPTKELYPKATIIRENYQEFQDHNWLNNTVNNFQKELLEKYDIVVFAEVDEIIAYAPNPNLLLEMIENMESDTITCTGFEPVHNIIEEPVYTLEGRNYLLEDRSLGIYHSGYNKTLISKVVCNWDLGFHAILNDKMHYVELEPTDGFYLIHLHRIDREYHNERKLNFLNKKYKEEPEQWGWQNKLKSIQEIDAYYVRDINNWEPIPEILKLIII
jgi:hypothetical protein